MNELFKKLPFVRLVIPFMAGIVLTLYLELDVSQLVPVALLIFILFVVMVYHNRLHRHYKLRWISGLFTSLLLVLCGALLASLHTDIHNPNHFSFSVDDEPIVLVKVIEPLSEKQRSFKAEVEVIGLKKDHEIMPVDGKAMFYFRKDSLSKQIKYGDVLVVNAQFKEISPPQNPSEFDYRQYLRFHNIYHQAFVSEENWQFTGRNEGAAFFHYVFIVRQYFFSVLDQFLPSDRELAVASALLLGYREHLDQDIIKAYSSSGAMHVLAVSGLHVGIIYLIFNFMFLWLEKLKHGHMVKAVVIVLLIWVYASVTGLSPSVQRAATMFSFIAIAKSKGRQIDIYNIIGVSAFVLLLIQPQIIMQVGFQLSYMAVIGIIFLHGRLYKLWYIKNWLGQKIWSLTCVSLAAQLATFPIGLLYFHQFPTFFLISNWVVIPAAFLILYVGVTLFAVSWIAPVAKICGTLLYYIIAGLNKSIFLIESMPHSLLQGFWIGILETWLIYLVIVTLLAFIIRLEYRWAVVGSLAAILLSANLAYETFVQNQQKSVIVYHVPNQRAIDFIDGTKNYMIADSSLTSDWSKMLFHIKHNWWESGVHKHQYISEKEKLETPNLWNNRGFIQFHDKRIAIVDQPIEKPLIEEKLKVDLLVLSGNVRLKIAELQEIFEFKKLVIDSSNKKWRARKWVVECEQLGIDHHSVYDDKAFVWSI